MRGVSGMVEPLRRCAVLKELIREWAGRERDQSFCPLQLGKVTTGTIIGYVGNSGDASNSVSHDHFEWHPGNGAAVDPFPYLNAVCLLPSETTNETRA